MQFRHGICSSCKAEYKIPASFAADRARCKKCGAAVEIGPVQDGEAPAQAAQPTAAVPPPVPASPPPVARPVVPPRAPLAPSVPVAPGVPVVPVAKASPPPVPPRPVAPPRPSVVPAPVVPPRAPAAPQAAPRPSHTPPAAPKLEEVTPSGKQRSGPSMKEKLLAARRAAEAGATEPVHRIEAAPPARRAAGDVGANLAPPVRREALAHPAPAAKAAAPVAEAASAAPVARAAARASGSGKKRPARGRGRAGKGDEDRVKKKSPMLLVGGVLGLLVVGAGTYFLLFAGDEPVQAKDGAAIEATIEDGTTGAENAAPGDTPSDTGDAPTDEGAAEGAADDVAGEDAEPVPAQPAAAIERDPSEIDLAAIPDFGPLAGTSDERWAELQEMVQTATFNTAAPGNRARIALEQAGKEAFPAILNVMKTIDYSTKEGYQNGDLLQRTLLKIANGANFGWKYTTEPNDVWFNKKAVQMWSTQWDRSKDNEAYWLAFTKQEAKADEAKEEGALDEKTEDALDDLDDL